MKKIVCLLLVVLMAVCSVVYAEGGFDLSSMSLDELVALHKAVDAEIDSRIRYRQVCTLAVRVLRPVNTSYLPTMTTSALLWAYLQARIFTTRHWRSKTNLLFRSRTILAVAILHLSKSTMEWCCS